MHPFHTALSSTTRAVKHSSTGGSKRLVRSFAPHDMWRENRVRPSSPVSPERSAYVGTHRSNNASHCKLVKSYENFCFFFLRDIHFIPRCTARRSIYDVPSLPACILYPLTVIDTLVAARAPLPVLLFRVARPAGDGSRPAASQQGRLARTLPPQRVAPGLPRRILATQIG
jgi:hypothetical protein